jgi:hypothetical protein
MDQGNGQTAQGGPDAGSVTSTHARTIVPNGHITHRMREVLAAPLPTSELTHVERTGFVRGHRRTERPRVLACVSRAANRDGSGHRSCLFNERPRSQGGGPVDASAPSCSQEGDRGRQVCRERRLSICDGENATCVHAPHDILVGMARIAVQTRPSRGTPGTSAWAMGISAVFSDTTTWRRVS